MNHTEEAVLRSSRTHTLELAVSLWSMASAQYPKYHSVILDAVAAAMIETMSTLAVNARRLLDGDENRYALDQPRWRWEATVERLVVEDLREALNLVIHARVLQVGFEELPANLSAIADGAVVIPYVQVETDLKPLRYVDPFSMAHALLYGPLS